MALVKENYVSEETGLTLEKAYAILYVINCTRSNNTLSCNATFHIQSTTREQTLKYKPLEKKYISFECDVNKDPVVEAYNYAKGTHIEKKFDIDTETWIEVEVQNELYGWNDEIVE